jgi:hypothetical protein
MLLADMTMAVDLLILGGTRMLKQGTCSSCYVLV